MIFPGTSWSPAFIPARITPGPPLRRPVLSKSLQTLSANTGYLVTVKSTISRKARPAVPPATVRTQSFSLSRAIRSRPPIMGDSPKTDGVAAPTDRAVAAAPASLANYSFPEGRLKVLSDSTKTPIVLMACGSLSVLERHAKRHVTFC